MQSLKIYQSLWAMERRIPGEPERAHAESFRMIAEAGFHGVAIDPAVVEIEATRKLKPYFDSFDLECMVNAFPAKVEDMQPLYALANEFDASLVNIISGVMPIMPVAALPVIRRWTKEATAAGLTMLFETHRDSLLNDLYYTLQIIELMPEIRLCADLSHFVVDREMRNPITAVDQDHIDRVLERADCLQGRIASREQIQVQHDFAQHADWVEIFKSWWRQGMRLWRARHRDDATLIFLCELGPPPYAITDAQQRELSDRWFEALQMRDWITSIWRELEREDQVAASDLQA